MPVQLRSFQTNRSDQIIVSSVVEEHAQESGKLSSKWGFFFYSGA